MDQAQNLRNIIKQINQTEAGQARIITVTSGKGGVGKTSVSINLAIQFRKQGKSVIIFDADFGLANIEVMFGAIPKYNLADMIYRGKSIKDIIVKGPMDIGFISGGSGINGLGNLSYDQINYLVYKLRELESLADIIIVDTGAGISDSVLGFVASGSEVLLVATPEPTSITDAYALLKALNVKAGFESENTIIHVIANRVSSHEEGINLYNKLNVVVSKFLNIKLNFLGIVPKDDNLGKAVMQQKPVSLIYPNSVASKHFANLASELLKDEAGEENKKNKGLASAILKMLKNKEKKADN